MPTLDLPNDYYELPAGKLANIATFMEMKALPERVLVPFPADLSLVSIGNMSTDEYRHLFRAVGENLMWFSRLIMPDAELQTTLRARAANSFVLTRSGNTAGILELDYTDPESIELAFFGLVPSAIGNGMGRALIDEAIRRAFAKPTGRLWLHTCTLDHPQALSFYLRSGFKPYARMVEIHDDPRLQGKLPLTAAPQVPVLTP